MAEEDKKMTFIAELSGCAAKLIKEFQEEKESQGLQVPGKARSTQILLCELYNLRSKNSR